MVKAAGSSMKKGRGQLVSWRRQGLMAVMVIMVKRRKAASISGRFPFDLDRNKFANLLALKILLL